MWKFDPGFPVAKDRFDQRNEMFKRARWDQSMAEVGRRFYDEIVFKDKPGWRQLEYAAVNGSWSVEDNHAGGCAHGNNGLYSWNGPSGKAERYVAAGGRVNASSLELTRWVKSAARHFGADLIGVCRVHPSWVYSHEYNAETHEHYPLEQPEGCENAVVMAVEMDYETLRSESLVIRGVTVGVGYSKMAFTANLLATFIRGLGYRALPSGNDTALSVPMAMAAGLGESSRMGLLITEKYGPRVRLCKVFTDMPLEPDAYRPFGATEFCQTCKTCAKFCPSQAISHGEPTTTGDNISCHSGILKWYNDHESCFGYWSKMRTDCSQCIRICPFNKPLGLIHDFSRLLIRTRISWINSVLVRLDDLLGYQRKYPIQRFWNQI